MWEGSPTGFLRDHAVSHLTSPSVASLPVLSKLIQPLARPSRHQTRLQNHHPSPVRPTRRSQDDRSRRHESFDRGLLGRVVGRSGVLADERWDEGFGAGELGFSLSSQSKRRFPLTLIDSVRSIRRSRASRGNSVDSFTISTSRVLTSPSSLFSHNSTHVSSCSSFQALGSHERPLARVCSLHRTSTSFFVVVFSSSFSLVN